MAYNYTVYSKEMNKIKKLAVKKGTPYVGMTQNGPAVCFQYQAGMRIKGYSYSNMRKAVPAELKRLAA